MCICVKECNKCETLIKHWFELSALGVDSCIIEKILKFDLQYIKHFKHLKTSGESDRVALLMTEKLYLEHQVTKLILERNKISRLHESESIRNNNKNNKDSCGEWKGMYPSDYR